MKNGNTNTGATDMTNETTTTKFSVGGTYSNRTVGNSNCTVTFTVVARTRCFVTTNVATCYAKRNRFKVSVWRGAEHVKPWGSYSMAPSVGADQRVVFPGD